MNRIAKFFLGGVAVLAVILVVIFVAANLYLQSGDVQQRIRLGAEKAVGFPVTIKRTLFLPWSGLTLSGIAVPNPEKTSLNLAQAATFALKFELLPLLEKRLVISEISLNRPLLSLRQDDDNRWVPEKPAPLPPPVRDPDLPPTEKVPRIDAPDFQVELRRLKIHSGSVNLTDRRGRPVVQVNGINLDGNILDDGVFEGNLTADDLAFFSRIFPKKLRAAIRVADGYVTVSDLKAALAGGRLRSELVFRTVPANDPRFEIRGSLDEVSVPQLIDDAGGDDEGARGTLGGELRVEGDPRDAGSFTGNGTFALVEGQIQPLDFVRQLGNLFKIDELKMLELGRADVQFDIRDERLWVDELVLMTENLIISAKGPITFRGELDLDGRFMVNQKIQRQFRGLLSDRFKPSENADYRQIAFKMDGTVARPQTDLLDQITGLQLGNFRGLIEGFLQPPRAPKNDDTEDSKAEEN